MIVTGVANRLPEALSWLVYCDSAPGVDGRSLLYMQSPEAKANMRRHVEAQGDGWRVPFPGFPALGKGSSVTGLGQFEQDLMNSKAAPQPFRTWLEPLRLTHGGPQPYRRAVILYEDGQHMMQSGAIAPLFGGSDCQILTLDTGHWPMFSKADEFISLPHGLA